MTGIIITAATNNARIDEMGVVFTQMRIRVDAINDLIVGLLVTDENEATRLLERMKEVERNILGTPEAKRLAATELAELKVQVALVEERLDDIESNLLLNVYAEIDDMTSKPMYTNEKQRGAAFQQAQLYSAGHRQEKDELGKLNLDKARLEAQLREIEDSSKASRVIYGGLVARLENMTALIAVNHK